MKTIGKLLKETRTKKRYSLKKLSEMTKIREEFIVGLENENWEKLPEYAVVFGFVRSVAGALMIDENHAMALFRRDYPPQKTSINPKPDVSSKFTWSPKLSFSIGVIIILSLIIGYLGNQYYQSIRPPILLISEPASEISINGTSAKIVGQTDKDVTIIVNNQPVLVNEDGSFEVDLAVDSQTKEIIIRAISRYGKETVVHRNIEVVVD